MRLMKWQLSDIRFWLLVALLLRLPGIIQPPLEPSHAWRQSLTNMVSRHYYENQLSDIMNPRSAMIDKKSDLIGQEFPTYNLLHATIARVFGWRHWYGRLVNLLWSTLAIYCFYLFLARFLKDEIALIASLILLVSIWFSFSRKLMPDVWSVSWVLIGLWSFTEYVIRQPGPIWRLLLGLFCVMIGALSKLPAVLPLTLLWLPLSEYGHLKKKWAGLFLLIPMALIPVWWWYFVHVPEMVQKGGYQLFFPYSLESGWGTFSQLWKQALEKLYFSAFQAFTPFVFLLIGLVILFLKRDRQYLFLFFASLLVLLFFAVKTGEVFPTHNYYVIPFVPIMAVMTSLGLNIIPQQNYRIAAMAMIAFEALLNQASDFYIREDRKAFLRLEECIAQSIPQTDTIAVYTEGNPVLPYFLHRTCIRVNAKYLTKTEYLPFRRSLHYFVALKEELPETPFKVIQPDEDLWICEFP